MSKLPCHHLALGKIVGVDAMAEGRVQTSSVSCRRRRISTESPLPNKKPKQAMPCFLRSCSKELNDGDERAEIRTCLPVSKRGLQSFLQSSVVQWSAEGDAYFHRQCWSELLRNSRVRNPKNMTMRISADEKRMIKEAAKTVEFHDSRKSITDNAKRIASMIKSSKYCVAFTGAGISTAAGIGLYKEHSLSHI